MPRPIHGLPAAKLLVFVVIALAMIGCSDGGGGSTPPPGGGPPPGVPSGVLVAAGTGYIHTFDLANGAAWSQRLSYSAPWSTVATVPADRELLIASTSGAQPVIVEVFDIDTFGLKTAFEWPDSTTITTLHSMAATIDGAYLATVLEPLNQTFLEIIERDSGRIVYSGLPIATGATMAWTADDRLVVAIDISYENDSARWGAIVAFPLSEFEASTDGSVEGTVITSFTRAEWDYLGVSSLALSHDDSQLAFERAGDLWVVDMQPGSVPHQLTTGPASNHGVVFSPDSTHLAFASGGRYGLDETYVIPNHRDDPLFIDHGQGIGNSFLLEANTLVDFALTWLK